MPIDPAKVQWHDIDPGKVQWDAQKGGGLKEITAAPEFAPTSLKSFKVAGGLLSSSRPSQEMDIIRDAVPDVTFEEDEEGAIIATLPSGRYYLNKPGLSGQDVLKFIPQAAAFMKGAKVGARGGKAVAGEGLLPRAAGVGVGSFATSAALDSLATLAGSKQGIDPMHASIAGAFGAGAEFAAPAIAAILRPGWQYLTRRGKVPTIQEARQLLRTAGVEADLPDEAVQRFITLASDTTDSAAAARVAEAEALPVPVKLTRGQATGDPAVQMAEDIATKGDAGETARRIMAGVNAEQQAALRENIPAIQGRIGGRQVLERGEGGRIAQEALNKQADAMRANTKALYEVADATKAGLPEEAALNLANSIEESVSQFLTVPESAVKAIGQLRQLTKGGADFRKLQGWRRMVSQAARLTNDPTEGAALKAIRDRFDQMAQDAVEQGLLQGDEAAVQAWKDAIGSRAQFGKMFEGKDILQTLTEKGLYGGQRQLKVDPSEAANYIFGRSNNFANKGNIVRDMKRLKQALGADSEAFNAVREEAFLRLASAAEGAYSGGQRQFSGSNFKKALEDALRKNPEVMRELFKPQEIQLLKQFADVAARVTNPVKGGQNTSNTGSYIAKVFSRLAELPFFGLRARDVVGALPGGDLLRSRAAAGSMRNVLPRRELIPAGALGGAGAAVGTDAYQSNQ